MNADEAHARMQEIQRIMERATLFTLLPGWAAVLGGLMVLAGCGVSYWLLHSVDFGELVNVSLSSQMLFCVMWFLIGVGGILLEVVFTLRAAARQQLVPSDRPLRVAAFSLTPCVIVAMVLTVKFLIPVEPRHEEIQYILPIWMMLYGTGVYTAGLFSIRPPRLLGLTFLAMGVIALAAFQQYGVIAAALSFGLLHIVFGVYVLSKQQTGELGS